MLAVTQSILREYARVALAVRKEEGLPIDQQPWLNAVAEMAFEFEPAPLRNPCAATPMTSNSSPAPWRPKPL